MSQDKFDYFMIRTDDRLAKMEDKLDIILRFRWQIIGGAGAIGVILSAVITVVMKLIL